MKHLIIYTHYNESSFNAAVRDTILHYWEEQKHEVRVRDLYQLPFNPILTESELNGFVEQRYAADIASEQEHIQWADVLYFVFPMWWYSMPAILKGYMDRVLANGFAFQSTDDGPIGLLKGKKAFVFQTAGDSEEWLAARDLIKAVRTSIDVGILNYCGLEVVDHKIMTGIHHVSDSTRKRYLSEVQQLIASVVKDR